MALFISHRRGIYYAFMTIAFGQIFWTIAIKSHSITGGEDGLLKIARLPADFGFVSFDLDRQRRVLLFRLAVFALVVIVLWRLVHSPYGRVLSAIRQSETRAAHLGYNVWLYKVSVVHALGGVVRARRRPVRHGAARRLSRRDEPASVRLRRDDDAGRRRARQLLGTGGRRVRCS